MKADRWAAPVSTEAVFPTKSLLHGAETLCTVREAASVGVNAEFCGYDLDKMYARRDEVVAKLRGRSGKAA